MNCLLCENALGKRPVQDGESRFCCHGCHAVYNILKAKNTEQTFQSHPIFHQALKAGLISNPDLLEEIQAKKEATEWVRLHLEITDLFCPSCADVISWTLLKQKGVRHCLVDYATDLAVIEYDPQLMGKDAVHAAISRLGYHPRPLEDAGERKISFALSLRLFVAAVAAINAMMLAYPLYATYFTFDAAGYAPLLAWLSAGITLPAVTFCAWPIWRRGIAGWRIGKIGMETLVMIGVSAALILSFWNLFHGTYHVYFDAISVIIAFVLLGKVIESRAKFSAKAALFRLMRAIPRRGRKRFSDGSIRFVPIKEFSVGDHLIILGGEKVSLDGQVTEGEGSCDESLMTGEAIPVWKKEGSEVLAGTLFQQGKLVIKVTATPEETALQRIVQMVETGLERKETAYRPVDHIARWFVPLILLWTAILAFLGFDHTFNRVLSVLLISCPCALGIAVPLVEARLLDRLGALGAIVRNRNCLKWLGKTTIAVFDKTGTLTEGTFRVLKGLEGLGEAEKCRLKGLVSHSIHPIAAAIDCALDVPPASLEEVVEVVGKGIRSKTAVLGSAVFLQQEGIPCEEVRRDQTTVYYADEGVHQLILGDDLKPGAEGLKRALAPMKTFLISGDAEAPVAAVATRCQFDQAVARQSPLEKRALVDRLRADGELVMVVGDGINDAPALAGAHVGISVVSATDISVQVSDLLLTTKKLDVIPKLHHLGKRGHRLLTQNLFWAFFYNVIGIGLATANLLNPLFSAGAMVISSLVVVLNARRL